MPISRPDNIPIVMYEIINSIPKSILDIGVGFGINGVLFRAYTDIRMSENKPKRYKEWETVIDGIEYFHDYKNSNYQNYNTVIYGDASKETSKMIDCNIKYDIVYLGDIIEHFTKEKGLELLSNCKKIGSKIIITTPRYFREQGCSCGNDKERHLSFWKAEDFMGAKIYYTDYQLIAII